jgi:hypothetical protein
VLVTVAGAYLLLLGGVYLGQSHLLYLPGLPSRDLAMTPKDIGLAYEDVWLRTDDGVRLHAWYLPAAQPRGTLLFFHGNAGNISHRLDSLRIFHQLKLSVLIFDYRGYGRSEGSPSEEGTRRDAAAAWRYLMETRAVAPQQTVLFGRSLGAAVAAQLATQQPPGALIVESAFTSVPDMAAELYWWMPARWLSRFEYATRDYVAQVRCPVLVVHSPEDEIIPFHHGEAIFAAAREPKTLLRLRGSHNEGFLQSGATYTGGLDAFVTRNLSH